jgi:hypothetical protein
MQISFNRTFTQRDFSRGDALVGQLLRVVPARSAGDGSSTTTSSRYAVRLRRRRGQDDWKVRANSTVNGGFRWDFNSAGEKRRPAQLHLRSDDRQSDARSSRDRPGQVMGGLTFRGVERRARVAVKSSTRTTSSSAAGSPTSSREDRDARRLRPLLPQPDGPGQTQGSASRTPSSVERRNGRRSTT